MLKSFDPLFEYKLVLSLVFYCWIGAGLYAYEQAYYRLDTDLNAVDTTALISGLSGLSVVGFLIWTVLLEKHLQDD